MEASTTIQVTPPLALIHVLTEMKGTSLEQTRNICRVKHHTCIVKKTIEPSTTTRVTPLLNFIHVYTEMMGTCLEQKTNMKFLHG